MRLIGFLFFLLCSLTAGATSLSMKGILGESSEQTTDTEDASFKRVLQAREFEFPRDHLSHQGYQTEWWYFSGNLSTVAQPKQSFAYQFTLFRFAMRPDRAKGSPWRSNNIYMAHIALTDINRKKIYQQERFSRDGPGLAGAAMGEDGTIRIWLNNWQAKSLESGQLLPLELNIPGKQFTLKLQLQTAKAMVLQGDKGFSQKSHQPGNASYYYSYTRLLTQGSITIGQNTFPVTGHSWLDREWSTSSLGDDQQGWDWFSLQLDDGRELMLYQMRKKDGAKDDYSSGTLIDDKGRSQTLHAGDFDIQAREYWQSPLSGIRYPIKWQVLLPDHNLELIVSAQVKHQEWAKKNGFSFNYWEGAVKVHGMKNQAPISGSGYLEMTGYE